jgi:nucleoside-diphosphate-sugar epimerase
MAVLVTGATGLIGRSVVDGLADPVYAASRSGSVPDGVPSTVSGVKLDLLDDTTVETLPWSDIDEVVHLAAYTHPRDSVNEPHTCFETNACGTSALLSAADDADVSAFVYLSSYWVYDSSVTGKLDESTPTNAETPYGASKAAAELQCNVFRVQSPMAVTTLRPFNVYGPGARSHQIVPEFVHQAVADGVIRPHPGNPVRDFLYVEDVTAAIRACLEERANEVFNIGAGVGTSIHELARTVAEAVEQHAGTPVETEFRGDPKRVDEKVAAVDKIRSAIGWRSEMSLRDGIGAVVSNHPEPTNDDTT